MILSNISPTVSESLQYPLENLVVTNTPAFINLLYIYKKLAMKLHYCSDILHNYLRRLGNIERHSISWLLKHIQLAVEEFFAHKVSDCGTIATAFE